MASLAAGTTCRAPLGGLCARSSRRGSVSGLGTDNAAGRLDRSTSARSPCARRLQLSVPKQRLRASRRANHVCASSSPGGSGGTLTAEVPIFPLNMVAHPSVIVPLNIFEARYRVLFNTLLAGSSGLEDGLVNEESPFAGTRKFGMCYLNSNGELSAVGTLLDIQDHQRHDDGRLAVVSKGGQKFRILEVKQERPVLICEVELLPTDSDAEDPGMRELRDEVAALCNDTVRLICKMQQIPVPHQPELADLGPFELSHYVAFTYERDSAAQQTLLELDSTELRLSVERDRLKAQVSYLSAASALENAFKEDAGA
eukprot:jgi/Tetstr1/427697/TSEL_017822.t1